MGSFVEGFGGKNSPPDPFSFFATAFEIRVFCEIIVGYHFP